jgi:hypothetical protein
MPKIIILNQCTTEPRWQEVDQLGQNTWGKVTHPDVKMFHYYGAFDSNGKPYDRFSNIPNRGEIAILPNNIMVCGVEDVLGNYFDPRGERYIMALEYCLNNFEFDYIYRTTCTSYIDIYKMYNFFNKLKIKEKFYDGLRNMYEYQYLFTSGYHVMLSRDVVEVIVEHKDEYLKLELPEDVAVGALLIHTLKYASFENNPDHNTSATPLGNSGFNHKNYLNTSVFNYRLNTNLGEQLLEIHNYLENNRELNTNLAKLYYSDENCRHSTCYHCDKGRDHDYINLYYNDEFDSKKNKSLNILEIGVSHGGSIKLWNDFFPNSKIIGLDIQDNTDGKFVNNPQVTIMQLNAYTDSTVLLFEDNYFDYIIDDGPHTLESQILCIQKYLPKIKSGGKIIIEDIQKIEWIEALENCIDKNIAESWRTIDIRESKGRYDDIIFEVTKK